MSRTLSTNVTNGKAGDSISVYLLEIDYGPVGSLTTLRYSTLATADFPTAWTGTAHTANNLKRSGIGDITDRCDVQRGGNVADVGGFTITLGNGNLVSDTLDTYAFYNRRIELRLIFADQTSPSWANATPLFYGFIDRVGPWDYDGLKISAKGGWRAIHRNTPHLILTEADYDELPIDNRNKLLPLLYGDWHLNGGSGINASGIASNLSPSLNYTVLHDYFLGYLNKPVKYYDTSGGNSNANAVYCGHAIHTRSFTNGDARIVRWNEGRRVFGLENIKHQQPHFGENIRGGTSDILYKASSSLFRIVHLIPVVDTNATSGATNPEYAVDEDDTNYAVLDANGEVASYEIPTASGKTGVELKSIGFAFYIDAINRVDDKIQYRISKNGSVISTWADLSVYGTFATVGIATSASPVEDSQVGSVAGYQIEFKYVQVSTLDAGCSFRIKSVYLGITEPTDESVDSIMQTGKGRFFHSFIDVANHSNSFSAGDLIENPAYVAESVLCQEVGLTPAGLAKSLDFDGSNDYAMVKHSESLELTGDFTLIAWVYPDSYTNNGGLIRKAESETASVYPANYDWYLRSGSGLPTLGMGDGTKTTEIDATNPPASTGAWVHLAVKVSGTTVTHYRNGATNGGGTNAVTRVDLGGPVVFGRAALSGTPHLDGRLDEVKMYNRALSDAEVLADYNSGSGLRGKTGEPNLVGNWHFDEGSGTEFRDWSGNNNVAYANAFYPAWAAGKVESTRQIYEPSFDTVAGERSSWKFAAQILDAKNSRELLRQIAYEGGFAYHTRPDGLEALALLTPTGSPTALTTADVLMDGKKSSMRVWRGDIGNVRNEFILHYRKNMATGEFEKTLFVKNPQSAEYDSKFTNLSSDGDTYWQKCSDAYADFQQVNTWDYNAEWIRDDATAELFIKWMIDWLTRMPLFCSFDTTIKNIGLSLFDQKLINHPLLPAAENGVNHFLLIEQKISPSTDTMSLTFMDIGTP